MNKQDRKELNRAQELFNEAIQIVQAVAETEMEKYDNLNEGLQSTERGEKLSANSMQLEDCASEIEMIVTTLDDIMQDQT